jgi:hypothetical protein
VQTCEKIPARLKLTRKLYITTNAIAWRNNRCGLESLAEAYCGEGMAKFMGGDQKSIFG